MKHYFLAALALIASFSISCNKGDVDGPQKENHVRLTVGNTVGDYPINSALSYFKENGKEKEVYGCQIFLSADKGLNPEEAVSYAEDLDYFLAINFPVESFNRTLSVENGDVFDGDNWVFYLSQHLPKAERCVDIVPENFESGTFTSKIKGDQIELEFSFTLTGGEKIEGYYKGKPIRKNFFINEVQGDDYY